MPTVSQPSSTITAAFLVGMGVTLIWLVLDEIFEIRVSQTLVSLSTTFGASLAGYFKKENVYMMTNKQGRDTL